MDQVKRKRDRLEVIYDLLSIISSNRNSIRVTPLLRASALSSVSFSEYLEELISKDFVKEIKNKDITFVTLTDKGFTYLEKYKLITGFIDEFEL